MKSDHITFIRIWVVAHFKRTLDVTIFYFST